MRKLKRTIIAILLTIFIVGCFIQAVSSAGKEKKYEKEKEAYIIKRDKFVKDSIKQLESIVVPENGISFKNSSASNAYLSASQGIEVHLKGLNWRGYYIDKDQPVVKKMRDNFDGYYKATIDKIEFDPDFENNGYPDFITEIKSAPSFYQPDMISKYLQAKDPAPYKSYKLNGCDKRKAVMDLWLVTFDITFRIEPNYDYNLNLEQGFKGKHPIIDQSALWLRMHSEYNNMKYDRLSVLLEFKPKNFYYLSSDVNDPLKPLNKSPKIGIGAVECINFTKVGEKGVEEDSNGLGVEIEKGKSLPLYPTMQELLDKVTYHQQKSLSETVRVKDLVSTYENIVDICSDEKIIADPNFFNSSKYSVIDIKKLGSWEQDKKWFFEKSVYKADYFHVKLLVHLYVLGEWVVKDENLIKFEARPPSTFTKPGLWDYLFPDFNLGIGGLLFSVLLVPLLFILLLSFLIPSVGKLVNYFLKRIFYKKVGKKS